MPEERAGGKPRPNDQSKNDGEVFKAAEERFAGAGRTEEAWGKRLLTVEVSGLTWQLGERANDLG